MTGFQLIGLCPEPFAPLFSLSAEQLVPMGIGRVRADSPFGFPCRVSLRDAEPGEELLLLSYEHLSAQSPYRATGPIFVGVNALKAKLQAGEIPAYVIQRQISVRAYDSGHMMVGAEVCSGDAVESQIQREFDNLQVSYIHLHNAQRGCFSCRVERAPAISD